MLSVEEVPTSDAAARSGTLGATGAVLSMVIVVDEFVAVGGPESELLFVTALAATLGINVPSPHPDAVTVNVVPLDPLTEKLHPVEVPEFVRSLPSNPLTLSEKVRVYVKSLLILVGVT